MSGAADEGSEKDAGGDRKYSKEHAEELIKLLQQIKDESDLDEEESVGDYYALLARNFLDGRGRTVPTAEEIAFDGVKNRFLDNVDEIFKSEGAGIMNAFINFAARSIEAMLREIDNGEEVSGVGPAVKSMRIFLKCRFSDIYYFMYHPI